MTYNYWKVNYSTDSGDEQHVFISAAYSDYDEAKVIKILSEVHPEWRDICPKKVSSVPLPIEKK
tara:strand:- start:589 stop:780 length:192 start_codon:yes stop_codon:yes gene_type:complete